MNKNEKVILQCADCDHKFKKTIKWLENTHQFECAFCHSELDIDEVIKDINNRQDDKTIYIIYQK